MTTDKHTPDLARVFAESVESRPSAYDELRKYAAADVSRDLPDAWVDAEKLREVVADHHIDMSEELMEALGALLPTPPAPRTMDEIEWDDAEHHLAEALFGDTRKVVMLARDTDEEGDWSEWISCRMEDGSTDLIEKAHLAPTGRKYRLEPEDDTPTSALENVGPEQQTLARDIFGSFPSEERHVHWAKPISESASPRPEDVPVGEAWQVEVDGETAIGYRNGPGSTFPWATIRDDDPAADYCGDDEVTLIARLVPETTEQDEEPVFDPDYIYTDSDGDEWEYIEGRWITGETHAERVAVGKVRPGTDILPAEYGPYTRIEKETHRDQ